MALIDRIKLDTRPAMFWVGVTQVQRTLLLLAFPCLLLGCGERAHKTSRSIPKIDVPMGSIEYLDARNGFRDLTFGQSFNEIEGMIPDRSKTTGPDSIEKFYVRKDEELSLGNVTNISHRTTATAPCSVITNTPRVRIRMRTSVNRTSRLTSSSPRSSSMGRSSDSIQFCSPINHTTSCRLANPKLPRSSNAPPANPAKNAPPSTSSSILN